MNFGHGRVYLADREGFNIFGSLKCDYDANKLPVNLINNYFPIGNLATNIISPYGTVDLYYIATNLNFLMSGNIKTFSSQI